MVIVCYKGTAAALPITAIKHLKLTTTFTMSNFKYFYYCLLERLSFLFTTAITAIIINYVFMCYLLTITTIIIISLLLRVLLLLLTIIINNITSKNYYY